MKYNKKNFPVNARPKDYERWGNGFFAELRETHQKQNERWGVYAIRLKREIFGDE